MPIERAEVHLVDDRTLGSQSVKFPAGLVAAVATLTAEVAALTAKVTPEKLVSTPRTRAYDPTAAMSAPAMPDIYDAAAVEADLRAIGRFPRMPGQSSGSPGINLVEAKPYADRSKFGEHIVDAICDRFLKD
jgi:hypothetical protein